MKVELKNINGLSHSDIRKHFQSYDKVTSIYEENNTIFVEFDDSYDFKSNLVTINGVDIDCCLHKSKASGFEKKETLTPTENNENEQIPNSQEKWANEEANNGGWVLDEEIEPARNDEKNSIEIKNENQWDRENETENALKSPSHYQPEQNNDNYNKGKRTPERNMQINDYGNDFSRRNNDRFEERKFRDGNNRFDGEKRDYNRRRNDDEFHRQENDRFERRNDRRDDRYNRRDDRRDERRDDRFRGDDRRDRREFDRFDDRRDRRDFDRKERRYDDRYDSRPPLEDGYSRNYSDGFSRDSRSRRDQIDDRQRGRCSHCDRCPIHGRSREYPSEKFKEYASDKFKIVCSNIPDISSEEIEDVCKDYNLFPTFTRITKNRKHAIIEFKNYEDKEEALRKLNNMIIKGMNISVREYKSFSRRDDEDDRREKRRKYDDNVDMYGDIDPARSRGDFDI